MEIINRLNRYIDNNELEINIHNDYIHIINYNKINSFSNKIIKIDKISIIGNDLVISKLTKEELLIIGDIYEVKLI